LSALAAALADRYHVERELGRGGMGIFSTGARYRWRDPSLRSG